MRRPPTCRRAERGSASVLVALWVVVLVVAASAAGVIAAVLHARVVAASAADLAALAAASDVLAGETVACQRAGAVARANDARLESCSLSGAGVRVTVSVPAPAVPAQSTDRLRLAGRAHAELVAQPS